MWSETLYLNILALLKLFSHELADCKFQITQLTSQMDNIFATLDQTDPKHSKRGIIHSLFGDANSAEEINAIKNSMAILEENQDILSSQIQKTCSSVNLTCTETDSNWLLLKSLQKDILQINSTGHCLSKELKALFHDRNFLFYYISVKKSFSNSLHWNKFS